MARGAVARRGGAGFGACLGNAVLPRKGKDRVVTEKMKVDLDSEVRGGQNGEKNRQKL